MNEKEKYRLSTYETIEIIKKTDTCSVELAENTLDGKKYIKKTYYEDKREVMDAISKIDNPYIPRLHEVFFTSETIVIEEYVQGITLAEYMAENSAVMHEEVLFFINNLVSAVEALHLNNIIHRDIKPTNIIITPEKKAVLIDFGIARLYKNNGKSDTEKFGTVGYAAPEQFGFSESDFRTDIYSVGVTVRELCRKTKRKTFLKRIADKCTRFDPSKRYQKMAEIKTALNLRKKCKFVVSAAFILSAVVLCITLLFNNKKSVQSESLSVAKQPDGYDSIDYDDNGRLIWMYDVENIPGLIISPEEEYKVLYNLGEGLEDTEIAAKQNGEILEVTIDGKYSFSFKDPHSIRASSYPEGVTHFELLFYDLNSDGIEEIIPIMSNAFIHDHFGKDDLMVLRNYSHGFCIYLNDGEFVQAKGTMTSWLEPFTLYKNMPGCISVDYPMYYKLVDGELKLFE